VGEDPDAEDAAAAPGEAADAPGVDGGDHDDGVPADPSHSASVV
jgi:hypothetical protein